MVYSTIFRECFEFRQLFQRHYDSDGLLHPSYTSIRLLNSAIVLRLTTILSDGKQSNDTNYDGAKLRNRFPRDFKLQLWVASTPWILLFLVVVFSWELEYLLYTEMVIMCLVSFCLFWICNVSLRNISLHLLIWYCASHICIRNVCFGISDYFWICFVHLQHSEERSM